MNILPVVYQILMLFIIAAMGLLLRARGVFTDPVIKGVNSTVLMVTWPAMMLMTTQREFSLEVFEGFMIVLGGSIVVLSLACALAYVLLRGRVEDRLRPVLCMLAAMPNAGYIGLPIVEAVYGDAATVYLAAYIVGFNIVLWTIGVSLFTGFHIGSLKGMLNPGFICAVLGTILFLLSIRLPTPILSAVNQLGALNTPLSMLLLGARMDTLRPRQLLNAKLWIVTGGEAARHAAARAAGRARVGRFWHAAGHSGAVQRHARRFRRADAGGKIRRPRERRGHGHFCFHALLHRHHPADAAAVGLGGLG